MSKSDGVQGKVRGIGLGFIERREDTVFWVFICNQCLGWLSEARDQGLMSERTHRE